MKILVALILFVSFSVSGFSQDELIGDYWTPDKDGKIKVYKSGGKYYATLFWVADENNERSKKPNGETTIGSIILNGFVYKKENLWADGVIVDPAKLKEYSCKIWLDENNDLMARGFIGISLLGRTEKFQRIK